MVVKQQREVSTGKGRGESDRREERAQRILDTAAALILRWGYNKTTIDDIARQAGVAKGTIYLHWKTREELFATLMKREKLEMAEEIRQRILADPEGGMLSGLLKHSTLAMMQRPLMKAVLLRDMEILGKLAQREHSSAGYGEQLRGFVGYLELLRERGLVRSDMSLREQIYSYSAIFMGFMLAGPVVPDGFTVSDEEMAELMAETVHRTLEPTEPISAEALQEVSQVFLAYLDKSLAALREQFQQEV